MKKAGKPLVFILSNGRPLDLHQIEPLSDAIVEIWQPGIAGAVPLAGILSGRVNPSGKLSITFPYSTGQIPIYYNARQSSRPGSGKYQDIPSTPLYGFAHGLSYTDFEYGDLTASSLTIRSDESLTVEIPVSNTGQREGAETVHWYISDPVSSITRPVKELKFFEKRMLQPGETHRFTFKVDPRRDLSYVNADGDRLLEPGVYYILVKDKKLAIEIKEYK
jgi:beta-glucosidase